MYAHANDIVIGTAAGAVATVPMSLTMEGLHRILPGEHRGALPPREVTEGLYGQLPVEARPASEDSLQQATLVLHYAYGGAAGALFTLMAPPRLPAAIGAGILFGLTVWGGSYLGLLPALGVRHHARHDSAARSAMMIAAHVVWGATLGLILRGRPGLRAASADPDSPQL